MILGNYAGSLGDQKTEEEGRISVVAFERARNFLAMRRRGIDPWELASV